MRISRELLISYSSQLYAAVLGIVFIPVYLHYIGMEAYGLIGFSLMLQGITQFFDMGLAQTLMRETSQTRVNPALQSLTHALLINGERFFLLLGIILFLLLFIATPWLSKNWLNAEQIDNMTIQYSLLLMIALAIIRWHANFYRSGLLGYGLHNWVNTTGAIIATMRYIGVIPLLAYTKLGIIGLFSYQLLIGLSEAIWYRQYLYQMSCPSVKVPISPIALWNKHNRTLGALAGASWLWIAMTQMDKLLLSHWLPLEDYGHFTLAISAASVISLLAMPIGQMLQPRLNMLAATSDRMALLRLYSHATQILIALFVTAGSLVAWFAEPLLFFWTGNENHASQSAPILFWYALGNAAAALLTIPFMLQYAIGQLRLHLIGNLWFGLLWLPAIAWAGYTSGGIGTGKIWFVGNILFLLIWTSFVHTRLFPELPKTWLLKNIVLITAPIIAITYGIAHLLMPYLHLITPFKL